MFGQTQIVSKRLLLVAMCFQDLEGLELGTVSRSESPGLFGVIQVKLLGSRHQFSMGKLGTDPLPKGSVC